MFKKKKLPPLSHPILKSIRTYYEVEYAKEFGQNSGKGFYSNHDWRRIQHAIDLIETPGESVLDVGVGPGALMNFLHLDKGHKKVTGIDIRRYSKLVLMDEEIDYQIMNAAAMKFEDNAYDTVVCMEVLEHMPEETMVKALEELRRVAKKQLIMSVPFEEPEPLPSYHQQRFDAAKIQKYFPDAQVELLCRPLNKGWPWAIMIEEIG